MRGLDLNWLRAPADRDVIANRTVPDAGGGYRLELPAPPDPERFEFLALGDTGDSEGSGLRTSPQDAVAAELAADAALPESRGAAQLVLHLGDVVYKTGERRLYDRNFRRPYEAFLAPGSTVDNLTFRLPFLPVPGNHDYYDFAGWATLLTRTPLLGAGLRAVARELFAFSVPSGGSDKGRAYMDAFVARSEEGAGPLVYRPGLYTRIPNRYYQFRCGNVDFFAVDSNTLDSPSPAVSAGKVRAAAEERIRTLRATSRRLHRELQRDEQALERWLAQHRETLLLDPSTPTTLRPAGRAVFQALEQAVAAARQINPVGDCGDVREAVEQLLLRWADVTYPLEATPPVRLTAAHLQAMQEVADAGDTFLKALEGCLAELPEGEVRTRLLQARHQLDAALTAWCRLASGQPPRELRERLRSLSEAALDAQRELARERLRRKHRPEDHDRAQLQWLAAALAESERERPNAWRVVYLHHPLYTTIGNHCEQSDVQGVRENLLALLRGKVHLVLTGHAHAFEWVRSAELPHTGIFVTGGGGQVWLRGTILASHRFARYRDRYRSLRQAGAVECATGGIGPPAEDGEAGPLYHYLRIEVTPERLVVRPVGVRKTAYGFRREEPMPVYHADALPPLSAGRPRLQVRRLRGVEIRRGAPPEPEWL